MATLKTKDGTQLYYKDWGHGQPVVFCHGWPLNADMWEYQMNFLVGHGMRCIAYDRRGFGRSDQPALGYDYDTLADDLATLIDTLNLQDVVLVGFSMGGGEVARYVGRFGTKRVSKTILISSVTPYLVKAQDNPAGVDVAVFDKMRAGILDDRQKFISDFGKPFYGANHLLTSIPQATLDWTFGMAMQSSLKATYDCVASFSETDFRADLKAFNVPTLVIHGDKDETVPADASGKLTAKMIEGAQLRLYKGAAHGLCITYKDELNSDLLNFIESGRMVMHAA